MTAALICASHTPLMQDGIASQATRQAVRDSFDRLATKIRAFDPELVVQFSPDHFNGFFYDLMPSFCIGMAARSLGDWDTAEGPLPVPESEARELANHVISQGVDTAVSYRMNIDHGFVQIWEQMLGRSDAYPIIPIFVNCAAPPLPTYPRARALGEAVGAWAKLSGKRVLFVASGGLSHDPPTPDVRTAQPDVRERLIAGRNPTPEARQGHKVRVLAAGEAASRGEGPCQPLSPEWDQEVIAAFRSGDPAIFDRFDVEEVRRVGGRGANEILAWVAAFAAQSMSGAMTVTLDHYEPIDGWIAGLAMMSATQAVDHDR